VVAPEITACLFWASWATIADSIAHAYKKDVLDRSEKHFALDLLAYMALKGLWKNTLEDQELFYRDKLFRPLQKDESTFAPYGDRKPERYQEWRDKPWEEARLRRFLLSLRLEDKALLKLLADAGGAMRQDHLMQKMPTLRGKTSASLRSLKAHVNAGCKALDCAQILAEGNGSGSARIHEINARLGSLREVVIEVACKFDVDWRLLEPAAELPTTPARTTTDLQPGSIKGSSNPA
jgi:hypothetical protein